MRRALLATPLLLLPLGVHAETMTAGELQKLCATPPDAAVCTAYLRGAVAMYEAVAGEVKELSWFCPPRDGDTGVLRQLYLDWARDNEATLSGPAMNAVRAVLQDAYQCSD